jgi:uncharacterized repeat protein (TIGR02543 family)
LFYFVYSYFSDLYTGNYSEALPGFFIFAQGGCSMKRGSGTYGRCGQVLLCVAMGIIGILLSGCSQPVGSDGEKTQYTITFDSHGGSAVQPITANEGTAVSKPANPAKGTDDFLGWFSSESGGALYAWPHTLNANVTMHAQWREAGTPPPAEYTIIFYSHGGTAVTTTTANVGTVVGKPADPTKGSDVFLGWFSSESGGALYAWPHTLNENVTMHAQWREAGTPPPAEYTITFNSHGGSEIMVITADVGTQVSKPADPANGTDVFLGWFSAESGGALYTWPHTLNANVTMHAQWQEAGMPPPIEYTITFNSHGGTVVSTITANAGTAASKPTDPTKGTDVFLGWFSAESGGSLYAWPYTLNANVIMHAQWQEAGTPPPIEYTITFNSHGGTVVSAITANAGTAASKPTDPTKGTDVFLGWFNAESGGSLYAWPYTLNANVTMHAQWMEAGTPPPTQYTITFESHSGSAVTALTANEGTAVSKPTDPTLTGYTFAGWHSAATGGTAYTWPYNMGASVTMHAQWTAITYTMAYNANNGSGTMEASTHTYGMPKNLSANAFTRTGYTFGGWNTAANGSGTPYAAGANVSNLSSTQGAALQLYAQWTTITYTITYNLNGGTNGANPASYTVESLVITLAAPTCTGYTFDGWYVDNGFTGSAVTAILEGSAGDKTFYARWMAIAYTVAYNANGGGGIMAASAHTYDMPKNLSANAFTRTGYTFGGWNTVANGSGAPYSDGESVSNLGSTQGAAVQLYAQWVSGLSVNIFVWVNEDGNILVSNADITISKSGFDGKPTAFTAEVSGAYSGVQWNLNGDPAFGSQGTAQSVTIKAANYAKGSYYLGVMVSKAGVPYSTDIHVTVID